MASVQYERNEEVLSYEEKASLDELINKQADAENILEQSLAIVAQNEGLVAKTDDDGVPGLVGGDGVFLRITAVAGALTNQTKGNLRVLAKKKWAGHVVKDFPDPLTSAGTFGMSALQAKGVKAAVVYTGKNKANADCGWLLAFADTKALKRKIYAEVGPKSKFNNINWDKVEKELDKAGTTVNVYDAATKTRLMGTIQGTSGGSAVGAYLSG